MKPRQTMTRELIEDLAGNTMRSMYVVVPMRREIAPDKYIAKYRNVIDDYLLETAREVN